MVTPARIASLVRALQRGSRSEQRKAAAAVAKLARLHPESRDAAGWADAIPALVRLLTADEDVFRAAAAALATLAYAHSANTAAAMSAGAAQLLIAKLSSGSPAFSARIAAATIADLVSGSTAEQLAVWDGAIPALARLLRGSSSSSGTGDSSCGLCLAAGAALNALARARSGSHPAMLAAGVGGTVADVLQSSDSSSEEQAMAARLVCSLANDRNSAAVLAGTGVVPQLLPLLRPPSSAKVQEDAFNAVIGLTQWEEPAAAVLAADGLPLLLSLLQHSSAELPFEPAKEAISVLNNIACWHGNEVAAKGGISAIAARLSQPCSPKVEQAAVTFLHNVALLLPGMLDASSAAAATRGLVLSSAQDFGEHGQLPTRIVDALVHMWRSSEQNAQAMASAIDMLLHSSSSSSRVRWLAATLVVALPCPTPLAQAHIATTSAPSG